jgi:hypothetical protein
VIFLIIWLVCAVINLAYMFYGMVYLKEQYSIGGVVLGISIATILAPFITIIVSSYYIKFSI